MHHEVFKHLDNAQKLDEIHRLLRLLVTGELIIMSTNAEIQAAINADLAVITAQSDIIKSVTLLLGGIDKRIADALLAFQAENPGVDVKPLIEMKNILLANNAAMAKAVSTQEVLPTPPAPAPVPTP